jgi:hypothetical protein
MVNQSGQKKHCAASTKEYLGETLCLYYHINSCEFKTLGLRSNSIQRRYLRVLRAKTDARDNLGVADHLVLQLLQSRHETFISAVLLTCRAMVGDARTRPPRLSPKKHLLANVNAYNRYLSSSRDREGGHSHPGRVFFFLILLIDVSAQECFTNKMSDTKMFIF